MGSTSMGRGSRVAGPEVTGGRPGLGRHTNDHMTSFYLQTPAGFQIEYGYGGRLIDDRTWQVHTCNAASTWGHRAPATPVAT
jgi:hypothetical protein